MSTEGHILLRREKVAQCMAAAMTVRETREYLRSHGILNPETNKVWSITTIHRDMEKLREDWKENASRTIETHRAEMLNALRLIRRKAFAGNGKLTVALRALKQEAELLGLDEAKEILHEGQLSIVDQRRKADDALDELADDVGLPPVPEESNGESVE